MGHVRVLPALHDMEYRRCQQEQRGHAPRVSNVLIPARRTTAAAANRGSGYAPQVRYMRILPVLHDIAPRRC